MAAAWWLLAGGIAVALAASTCSMALRRFSWAKFDRMDVTRTRQADVARCVERSAGLETALIGVAVVCVVAMTTVLGTLMTVPGGTVRLLDARLWVWAAASAALALGTVWAVPAVLTHEHAERILVLVAPLLVRMDAALGGGRRPPADAPGEEGDTIPPAETSPTHEGEPAADEEGEAHEFLRAALRFRNVEAAEIMTPRIDMVSIHAGASLEEARRLAVEHGHSRMPVFEENRDRIVGVLYVKDLLRCAGSDEFKTRKVSELMRPAYFVPETKKVADLLAEFRKRKVHLAIVLDEYGGTAGVVTIEDVIEEVLGEIRDEYDEEEETLLRRVDDATVEVDAKIHVDELNDALTIDLPESDDYETLGGFITYTLGRIPGAGETLEADGVRLTVLEADGRKVDRVRVEVLRDGETR